MSTTAPTHQMVTEHAIRVAQKLSPAMREAMLKVQLWEGHNFLGERAARVGTTVALMDRDLMSATVLTAIPAEGGRHVEVDYDYEGRTERGHLLTELGEAVLQVLVRGPEEALKRAIAADEQARGVAEDRIKLSRPINAFDVRWADEIMADPNSIPEAREVAQEVLRQATAERMGLEHEVNGEIHIDAELPVEYSENLHEVLIMTSHRRYRIVEGDVFQGSTPGKLASETDMIHLEIADKAGLVEKRMTLVSKVNYFQLTDLGMRVLLTFDAKYGRSSMLSYVDGVPPREVLVNRPTKTVVAEYPEYYISGPGRLLAEKVGCGHGYRLTDSCPVCP